MAARSVPSEIIEKERKKLLEILQHDPDSVLDSLTSRGLISEEEYETLENVTDPLKKSRKLLILVQKRGEVSCQHFLKCLLSTFPESATVGGLQNGKLDFCTFLGGKSKSDKADSLKKEHYCLLFSFVFLLEIIFTSI